MAVVAPLPLARAFWRLMAARFFSTFATQMLSVVVGWQIYAHTHSPLALGAVGLTEAVPALSLALWAGYRVDHGNPETIFRAVLRLTLLSAAALLSLYVCADKLAPTWPVAALYAISLSTGAARAFYQPCMTVLLPKLVSREGLPRAAAWSGSTMQMARVLGPGLGGLLYSFVGPTYALGIVCALLVAASVSLGKRPLLVPTQRLSFAETTSPGMPVVAAAQRTGEPQVVPKLTHALLEGVAYVRRQPVLLSALTLDMVCVFFGSVTAVLPVFAEQVLACGPRGLGLLRAAPAFGSALASLWLTRIDIRPHAGRRLLLAVAGFGACTLAFAASHNFYLSLAILVLSGMLDSISVLVRQLIVQLLSPAHMRGRISSVNAMFIGSSNEIGEFESGVAAAAMGLLPSVVFGGTVCLLVVGAMAACVPTLRRLDLRHARSN